MKSPYNTELDPFQDRTIYLEEERLIGMSYEFLGWNPLTVTSDKLQYCVNHAHNYRSAFPNAWHTVRHDHSASDVTQWCTICRIYWKVDMSE